MLKNLVISLIVIAALSIFGYHYITSPEVVFDEEVAQFKITGNTRVVGYRVSKGGATVPFYYYYFFLTTSQLPNKQSPFMITSTEKVEITSEEEGKIKIKMKGEIISFRNEVWAKVDDKLISLKIDIDAQYQ